jgi:L-asparaginase II
LGQDPNTYLDPDGPVQVSVRNAVESLTGVGADQLIVATDGCSAPTFAMPMRALGQGIASVATPADLDPELQLACRRILAAAAAHPGLVAGRRPARFDTALLEASAGRLFAKGGADGVQVVGVANEGIAFVGKVDDGNARGLYPVVAEVLSQLGVLTADEHAALEEWVSPDILNADGLVVGQQVLEPIALAPR